MWRLILSMLFMEARKGIVDLLQPKPPAPPPPHVGKADLEHIRRQVDAATHPPKVQP